MLCALLYVRRVVPSAVSSLCKLQALVYDILPSTTAVFSYAIGSRKLSANEQFFCWCSNSSKFVTSNSNYIRRLFYVAMLLTPVQTRPKSFESVETELFLLPRVDASQLSRSRACLGARLLQQSYQYPNAKHWFTTSFLQPLPSLVTP